MKLKNIILTGIVSTATFYVHAQNQSVEGLKIGNKIPDFTFQNLQNTPQKTQKASDLYKRGLLIINFWATWCIPCVSELPFLDSMQLKNTSYYNMVCITDESKETLSTYLEKHRDLTHLKFLAGDKTLRQYFPHTIVPHNIWIDKNGTIKAITGDEEVNDINISAFLLGKANMLVKQEDLNFDWQKPLRVADTELLYRSVITPFKNIGNGGVLLPDSGVDRTRFLAWNRTKTDLIWAATMGEAMAKRDWSYVILNVKDSTGFTYPSYTNMKEWTRIYLPEFNKWSEKNQYCYEMMFSRKVGIDSFYSLMLHELSLYFNLRAEVKMQTTDCWVLKEIPGKLISLKDTSKTQKETLHLEGNVLIANNQSILEIARALNRLFQQNYPFVVGASIKTSINLNKDFKDLSTGLTIERLKNCLNEVGLDINLEKHPYPFLAIYQ